MGEGELFDQLLIGSGFLQHVEVGPVHVLDERLLQCRGVVTLTHQRGDPRQAETPRGPPAPLPGNQLELVADRSYQHRLEHPDLANGLGQLAE